MFFGFRSNQGMAVLLTLALLFQFAVLQPAEAANQAVRTVTGGVLGFMAGATLMTILGVGGLAVVAGCVAGVYIGKWVGKNLNSFIKDRKKDLSRAGTAVSNVAGTAADRLKDQEAKAAEFIKSLTGQGESKSAASPAEIDEAMTRYQSAYRAYNEAVQRGDGEAAKRFGEQYRALQARYQSLLKGR